MSDTFQLDFANILNTWSHKRSHGLINVLAPCLT